MPDAQAKAREMDLLSYFKNYEPQELVHFGGNTYCTCDHDSLKISNGKLLESDGELHIPPEEHAILREAYRLQHKPENMERQQIYFRGHTDEVAYPKKNRAI